MAIKILLAWVLLLGFLPAFAQKKYSITVKDAVSMALNNTIELKNLRLDKAKQKAQNREITGLSLPQVNGSAQAAHYLTLPFVLFPSQGQTDIYNVLSKEGVKDGNGNAIQPKREFFVQEFSFVQPWSINTGITVNQLLFQPEVFTGLLARKTLMDFADKNIRVAEDKTKEQVQKAYYQVLIAKQQKEVLDKTIQRIEKLYADQQELYKNGFIEKLDIDKTTVSLNNVRSTQTQLSNLIDLGYAALKFATGVMQEDTLILTDMLNNELIKKDILEEEIDFNNRSEMQLLQTAEKLGKIDLKRYQLGYIPTLAFFYQFQQQGQLNKNFTPFTGKDWFWFNSNLIGLSLNVPIFDGLQKKYKIEQAKIALEKTRNSKEQFRRGADLEHHSARINLKNALLNMDMQQKNLQLAEQVYQTTKKKYEQGIGSTFEVLQSDTEWQRAQGSYFEALYNAVIAKINFQKAIGKLDYY
ncbi:MAG: TolC family protein [Bacteroidetes bacterium]|nr:TolC family protein [Bacteroidota bacterium]